MSISWSATSKTLSTKFYENRWVSKISCPLYWVRHFGFRKSDVTFIISDNESFWVQSFAGTVWLLAYDWCTDNSITDIQPFPLTRQTLPELRAWADHWPDHNFLHVYHGFLGFITRQLPWYNTTRFRRKIVCFFLRAGFIIQKNLWLTIIIEQ